MKSMKSMKLFSLLSIVFSLSMMTIVPFSPAFSSELQENDYEITYLKGRITNVSPLCPPGVMCVTNGTSVTIEFPLTGCLDRADLVDYKLKHNNDKTVDIYVGVVGVKNRASWQVRCIKMPVKTVSIPMIMKFYQPSQIRLHSFGKDVL